jgi:hypothetical protein
MPHERLGEGTYFSNGKMLEIVKSKGHIKEETNEGDIQCSCSRIKKGRFN